MNQETDAIGDENEPLIPFPGTLRNRLFKGISARVFGQGIQVLFRLVVPPLFLLFWGSEKYGEWLMLSAFASYLTLSDFGSQMFIINCLTRANARGDEAECRKILHTGFALFLALPIMFLGLFTVAVWAIPWQSIFSLTHTSNATAALVLLLFSLQVAISLPQGLILGVYSAVGLDSRGNFLDNLISGLQMLLLFFVLSMGGGMISVGGAQILPVGIILLIALRDLEKRTPIWNIGSIAEASWKRCISFVVPSLHFLLIRFSNACSIQGMIMMAGITLGSTQAVVFATHRTLIGVVRQCSNLLFHSSLPEITRLEASRDRPGLVRLFFGMFRITVVLGSCFALLLHFWGGFVYSLWLGNSLPFNQTVMDLFIVYFLLFSFWTLCSQPLIATNRHKSFARVFFVSSLLSILLAYLGGLSYGLAGLVGGVILSDLCLPAWLVPRILSQDFPEISNIRLWAEFFSISGVFFMIYWLVLSL